MLDGSATLTGGAGGRRAGAVIGRCFDPDLLAAVMDVPPGRSTSRSRSWSERHRSARRRRRSLRLPARADPRRDLPQHPAPRATPLPRPGRRGRVGSTAGSDAFLAAPLRAGGPPRRGLRRGSARSGERGRRSRPIARRSSCYEPGHADRAGRPRRRPSAAAAGARSRRGRGHRRQRPPQRGVRGGPGGVPRGRRHRARRPRSSRRRRCSPPARRRPRRGRMRSVGARRSPPRRRRRAASAMPRRTAAAAAGGLAAAYMLDRRLDEAIALRPRCPPACRGRRRRRDRPQRRPTLGPCSSSPAGWTRAGRCSRRRSPARRAGHSRRRRPAATG